ncbi:MAG TPA: YdcF family protein [Prolixibacteraceae bacterium]|nr:YdcF family protein [Prolixibacteraceae bacterium]HPR85623.1 YdcF family protein [Prolixibacteraceae bacterium]
MVKQKLQFLRTLFLRILIFLGVLLCISFVFAFTSLPFWAYYWLGTSESKITEKPDYIVLLGGGGMPSESNLMRAYYVYYAAKESPESKIIISLPGDTTNSKSAVKLLANELIIKGIDKSRILYENVGTNTRMEGLCIEKMVGQDKQTKSFLIVTSPEHMRRAVKVFRKLGFSRVNALSAFEHALEASLIFKDRELGGRKITGPDIGGSITVRYQFWNHLKYEILVGRELTALAYYKLRGWI